MKNKSLFDWLTTIESISLQANRTDLNQLKLIAQRLNIWPISNLVITITGTNGKGSCVALLKAILENAGYKVGAYTSPHLLTYHERIICNKQPATDQQLCAAFNLIDKQSKNITLNYFEWTTLAALLIFKQYQLDVWILEVGVGGRLDPVNIIDADLVIIATIAIDHVNWLGHTRDQIGLEKAGIMRPFKPVICGDFATPAVVKEYARQISAPLFCQDEQFGYELKESEWSWWSHGRIDHLPIPKLELQNAATVLAAIDQLSLYFQIEESAIKQALINTALPGRFQKIAGDITQILDVAHNPAASEILASHLMQEKCAGRILAVFAMLSDKDHAGTIRPLVPLISAWYVANLNIPRGSQATQLAQSVMNSGGKIVYTYADVSNAYQAAMSAAQPGDYVVIWGSFYTVAEVLKYG